MPSLSLTYPQKFSLFVSVVASVGVGILLSQNNTAARETIVPTNAFFLYQDALEANRTDLNIVTAMTAETGSTLSEPDIILAETKTAKMPAPKPKSPPTPTLALPLTSVAKASAPEPEPEPEPDAETGSIALPAWSPEELAERQAIRQRRKDGTAPAESEGSTPLVQSGSTAPAPEPEPQPEDAAAPATAPPPAESDDVESSEEENDDNPPNKHKKHTATIDGPLASAHTEILENLTAEQ